MTPVRAVGPVRPSRPLPGGTTFTTPAAELVHAVELSRAVVEREADGYRTEAPLYAVEREQVETLPSAFESGSYGWRDAAWVVRWYYRRHLGAYPDDRRRAAEAAFGENDFEAIRAALDAAASSPDVAGKVERLTELAGVDVGVASAFLFFGDPDAFVVVGDREWSALRDAGALAGAMPDPVTVDAYERYLEVCRDLGERFGCSLWTLYRALWRLSAAGSGADG